MQSILGIDFSVQPCELCVVQADGAQLIVSQRQTVELPLFTDPALLCGANLSPIITLPKQTLTSDTEVSTGGVDEHYEQRKHAVHETLRKLTEALKVLGGEWTSSVVVMPPHDNMSLNLNLPFGDSKMVDQVIDLEVQDLVPFELDEFSVQHNALGPFIRANAPSDTDTPFDIHVGLLPRLFVSNILSLCKAIGVEPNVLTVPSSAIGAVFHLAKDFFTSNSAVILKRGDDFAVALYINGQVRAERTLRSSSLLTAQPSDNPGERRPIYTALKLLIAASERRYGTKIDKLYLLGDQSSSIDPTLHQVLGKPLESLDAKDFLSSSVKDIGIAPLAAVFARDQEPPSPLSNFRAREFSFTPKLGEFFRALLNARRQAAMAAISIVVCLTGVYLVREISLARSREALITQIGTVIPHFSPGDGDIRAALIKAEGKLSEELGVLGPIAKITPIDGLLEIMRLLPTDSGATITSIKVTGTRAQITGIAPQLSAIESVGKALRTNKGFFSKVTATPGTASGSRFNFSVDVVLSQ